MKLIFEFARIAAFALRGRFAPWYCLLPIPASVYGLMLLAAAALWGGQTGAGTHGGAVSDRHFPAAVCSGGCGRDGSVGGFTGHAGAGAAGLDPHYHFGHDGVRLRDPAPGRAEGEKAMITQVLESSAVWGVLAHAGCVRPGGAHQQAYRSGNFQPAAVGHGVCHRGAQRVEHPL